MVDGIYLVDTGCATLLKAVEFAVNIVQAEKLLRALPGITEKDHFGGDAFCANKRIFATAWHDKNTVNVRLTPESQQRFIKRDRKAFEQIDNAWGRQGWTTIHLDAVKAKDYRAALSAAFISSAHAAQRTVSERTSRTREGRRR